MLLVAQEQTAHALNLHTYIHTLLLLNAWLLGARSNAKRGPGSLEVSRDVFSLAFPRAIVVVLTLGSSTSCSGGSGSSSTSGSGGSGS